MNDLISREAAGKVVNAYDYRGFTVEQVKTITDGCAEEISRLPAVDAVPVRHGKWIKHDYDCGETEWECSACGETEWRASASWMKFCMYCGAKMDEEVSGNGQAQD